MKFLNSHLAREDLPLPYHCISRPNVMNNYVATAMLSVALTACSDRHEPPVVYQLKNYDGVMRFRLDAEYRAMSERETYIVLSVGYPSMRPVAKKMPGDRSIHFALRSAPGITEGEEILSLASPSTPEPHSFITSGLHGDLQRYKQYRTPSGPASEATYYIFRAPDKQVVLFIDEGNWSESFRLVRRVRGQVMLHATVPKSYAEKLVEADATLMHFVQAITIEE